MQFAQALVAHQETAKVCEPGHRTFHDPAVPSEPVGALDIFARNAIENAPLLASLSGGCVVVGFVGVEFLGESLGSPRSPGMNDWDGIEHARQQQVIVQIGCRDLGGQWNAAPIDHYMMFGAGFCPVDRVGPNVQAPLFAGRCRVSSDTRLRSSWSACANSSSKEPCKRFQMPRLSHSCKRRQAVTPEQPSSEGTSRQGNPERNTNKIALSAARSATAGRPPLRLRLRLGSNGPIRFHNLSLTNFPMPPIWDL